MREHHRHQLPPVVVQQRPQVLPGNQNAIRNVTIDNCVISGANRGLAFMLFAGGILENVVVSNCVIECRRFDWFWWGDGDPIHFNLIQHSDLDPLTDRTNEKPPGIMRNIRNLYARAALTEQEVRSLRGMVASLIMPVITSVELATPPKVVLALIKILPDRVALPVPTPSAT